ncbi:MAG: diguanylate cyclase [Methyloversatilis discipulorum]|jgi:diguanylate cyclase (GGDEF)-like protein|uniref:GGDEF domain-containing response regulator n=1 Tax=Methyloversatilis discipulorum TaxID=1119528 RepID=UPI0026EE94C2|nr:diguanylate cyclase [Methyloversatilis discipulorum]MBT9516619.1 diguanylate cyclase [Methyloversatilis discipulorum]MBV5286888.1 diguanylate cyclase [Methyloversatilis discipulorum]
MKALVIEDSQTGLAVVSQHLERMGILPIAATDGESGVAAFRQHNPDIVLLDVVLPGMDGYEVARRIRAIEQSGEWTPIIFLTARTADTDLVQGITAGGDDYLFKPISEVVLAAKVRAMQRILQMRYSLVVLTRKLDAANQELTRLTSLDGLTGLSNRRHFDETMLREWRRAARYKRPLSLVLVDVDHFKQYNDTYGHLAGDECLKTVASALQAVSRRPSDLVARYGGEEFALVLPETDLSGARSVAEGLCDAIRALQLPHAAAASGHVTISVGVASLMPGNGVGGPQNLIAEADLALYAAKSGGRDRVGFRQAETVVG